MEDTKVKDKIRVGILRGGIGSNYAASLRKGGEVITYINDHLGDTYRPIDILVDREGVWHMGGVPVLPLQLLYKVDLVWNLAQSSLSNVLESFSIPHIGVPAFMPAFDNGHEAWGEHLEEVGKTLGIHTPKRVVLPLYQADFDARPTEQSFGRGPRDTYAAAAAKKVFEKFASPWIVKSFTPDTSMGIHLARTFPELVNAIEDGVNHEKSIVIEEFVAGKVASVHSVPGFRGERIYTFPLITSPARSFGAFSAAEKDKLAHVAHALHTHIGITHYLKSDFVIHPRGGVYLLNVELHPNMKENSHLSESAESVGATLHHVIRHMMEKALVI